MSLQDIAYEIIPKVDRAFRRTPEQMNYNVQVLVLIVTTLAERTSPHSLAHFQLLNAATMQGVLALPKGFNYDDGSQSRHYVQEGKLLM